MLVVGRGEEKKKPTNSDLSVKQINSLFAQEMATFPKDWKAVNIKLKSPENKQKCIIVFEK